MYSTFRPASTYRNRSLRLLIVMHDVVALAYHGCRLLSMTRHRLQIWNILSSSGRGRAFTTRCSSR
jgi:hypothetical protein